GRPLPRARTRAMGTRDAGRGGALPGGHPGVLPGLAGDRRRGGHATRARRLHVPGAVRARGGAPCRDRLPAAEPPGRRGDQRRRAALRLVTAPASAGYVERLLGGPAVTRLSRAALEVLAIVAYRQPATRAEIEALRGVNSDRALETLLGRGLVAEVGRRDSV